jgi:hypothetical protein
MDRKTLLNGIQVDIKTYISEDSMEKFKDDVRKLSKRIPEDTKYVIIELYLQLGKPDEEHNNRVLDYKNKNDISVTVQPKINKNVAGFLYFNNRESFEKSLREECNKDDLYLCLEVKDGEIQI